MKPQQKKRKASQQSLLQKHEKVRLEALCKYENQARAQGFLHIYGVDEAGRGPLAGPVFAACCSIQQGVCFEGIDDSKRLTATKRELLFERLTTSPDVQFGVGSSDHAEIDKINILQATHVAMKRAVEQASILPDYLLVDGLKLNTGSIPSLKLIKGDRLSQSIAAASIIAKVLRDRFMLEAHKLYPEYGFDSHKGYGTKKHLEAIRQHGPCLIHRRSFAPIKGLL